MFIRNVSTEKFCFGLKKVPPVHTDGGGDDAGVVHRPREGKALLAQRRVLRHDHDFFSGGIFSKPAMMMR